MRITIDLDGATVQSTGAIQQPQQQTRTPDDIDAGPPPAELLETLAMEGALGPEAAALRAPAPAQPAAATAGAPEPVRTTWESSTLMRKRRD